MNNNLCGLKKNMRVGRKEKGKKRESEGQKKESGERDNE